MKYVLVINGSPRSKGNSDLLCDEFIRGAVEAGCQAEKVSLREKEIRPCRACYACFQTGACVQKDDMAELLEKAERADVLVLASPTYFLTMSGQMKTMIDRLLPKWQGLGGKDAWVIVTSLRTPRPTMTIPQVMSAGRWIPVVRFARSTASSECEPSKRVASTPHRAAVTVTPTPSTVPSRAVVVRTETPCAM